MVWFVAEIMEQRLVDDRINISLVISQMTNVTHRQGCGCLPGCTAVDYEKSQSSSEITVKLDIREDYLAGRDVKYFKYDLCIKLCMQCVLKVLKRFNTCITIVDKAMNLST